MSVAIVLTWMMSLLLAVLLLRQRFPDPAFAWSLRLAVLVSSLGMAVAFLMTTPTRSRWPEPERAGRCRLWERTASGYRTGDRGC